MKITYSDARKYILTAEDDTFLGSLKYENWTYSKAEITTLILRIRLTKV